MINSLPRCFSMSLSCNRATSLCLASSASRTRHSSPPGPWWNFFSSKDPRCDSYHFLESLSELLAALFCASCVTIPMCTKAAGSLPQRPRSTSSTCSTKVRVPSSPPRPSTLAAAAAAAASAAAAEFAAAMAAAAEAADAAAAVDEAPGAVGEVVVEAVAAGAEVADSEPGASRFLLSPSLASHSAGGPMQTRITEDMTVEDVSHSAGGAGTLREWRLSRIQFRKSPQNVARGPSGTSTESQERHCPSSGTASRTAVKPRARRAMPSRASVSALLNSDIVLKRGASVKRRDNADPATGSTEWSAQSKGACATLLSAECSAWTATEVQARMRACVTGRPLWWAFVARVANSTMEVPFSASSVTLSAVQMILRTVVGSGSAGGRKIWYASPRPATGACPTTLTASM
mmetsp:Transcript_126907/g.320578  ORF Transcript_126907/g.320578 Transcript_126907/m.320578 type:complete len:404 (+) Transcript_126907:2374-3585(+)